MMRKASAVMLLVVAALFVYTALDLPPTGSHESPAAQHVSPRYIEEGYQDTGTPNLVVAVLADYRSFDTLGEVLVIVIAGIAIVYIVGIFRPSDDT